MSLLRFERGAPTPLTSQRRRTSRLRSVGVASCVAVGLAVAPATALGAAYSYTQTIPVPPASNYAGSAGGDGWAVAMTPAAVYNVFHHGPLQVACHKQSDASACWAAPKSITDANSNGFRVAGQPSLTIDQTNGHLYVYATRDSDASAGVVCIDTTKPVADPNPFCGFTALAPAGDAPGASGVSNHVEVGTRLYAFNYVNAAAAGARNKLLCFDTATAAACAGQPFSVNYGAGAMSSGGSFRVPSLALIGSRIIVPALAGSDVLACYNTATAANCTGSWPVAAPAGYANDFGASFPMLTQNGQPTGLCLPTAVPAIPCFDLNGVSASTPAGLPAAVTPGTPWNSPAVTIGPRIYLPNGNGDKVQCYDYNTGAGCPNFPKALTGAGYLYSVNPDPQRPTCLWVNADNGASQIQNFDAFTGGPCGTGAIRVLASSIVVPTEKCKPTSYKALSVLSPARNTYTSGMVSFQDGSATPIPGAADRPLDAMGIVDLTGLSLNTPSGLPQFLITLVGASGNPTQVVVKLEWTAALDPSCVKPGTVVVDDKRPTRLTAYPALLKKSPLKFTLAPTAKLEALNPTTSLGGKTLTFKTGSTVICTVTTNAAGDAGCRPVISLLQVILGGWTYTVSFAGDSANLPASASAGVI